MESIVINESIKPDNSKDDDVSEGRNTRLAQNAKVLLHSRSNSVDVTL